MTRKLLLSALLTTMAAAADAPLPNLRIEPKAGGSIFFIKNDYSHPLTAYLIELVGYPGSSFSFPQDLLGSDPIAPGQERRIEVANMTVGAVPDYVKMQAAIFADGATAGIPQKVTQLLDRRRALLDTTRDLIRRLDAAVQANQSRETLIASLKQLSDDMGPRIKSAGKSPAALSLRASDELILNTAKQLQTASIQDQLAQLRSREKVLQASQPKL